MRLCNLVIWMENRRKYYLSSFVFDSFENEHATAGCARYLYNSFVRAEKQRATSSKIYDLGRRNDSFLALAIGYLFWYAALRRKIVGLDGDSFKAQVQKWKKITSIQVQWSQFPRSHFSLPSLSSFTFSCHLRVCSPLCSMEVIDVPGMRSELFTQYFNIVIAIFFNNKSTQSWKSKGSRFGDGSRVDFRHGS